MPIKLEEIQLLRCQPDGGAEPEPLACEDLVGKKKDQRTDTGDFALSMATRTGERGAAAAELRFLAAETVQMMEARARDHGRR